MLCCHYYACALRYLYSVLLPSIPTHWSHHLRLDLCVLVIGLEDQPTAAFTTLVTLFIPGLLRFHTSHPALHLGFGRAGGIPSDEGKPSVLMVLIGTHRC